MIVNVCLDPEWVYAQNGERMICLRKFCSKFRERFSEERVIILKLEICSCSVMISEEIDDLLEQVNELLIEIGLPADQFDKICKLSTANDIEDLDLDQEDADKDAEEAEEDEEDEEDDEDDEDDDVKDMKAKLDEVRALFEELEGKPIVRETDDGKAEETEKAPEESNEDRVQAILNEVNELIGADEFKAFCNELHQRAEQIRRHKTQTVLLSCVYLFFVNKGQQFDECIRLLASLMSAENLLQDKRLKKTALDLPVYGRSSSDQNAMETLIEQLEFKIRNADILSVDISTWAAHTDSSLFKRFIKRVAKTKTGTTLIVFRCLPQTDSITKKMMADIQDLLATRAISIRDYTNEEFLNIAEELLDGYGYKLSAEAKEHFNQLVEAERADGSFYGKYTIEKIANQLIDAHERSATSESDEITLADLGEVLGKPSSGRTADEMLAKVYGLESVKKQIESACQQILYAKKHGLDMPSFHMAFLGNPGTGKTTIARIVGQILHEAGALRIGNFYEHKARDLCGEYIGQTEKITSEICSKAYGSVLFLDEAYSLHRGERNDKDYGKEAIATLLTEMENHSNDFIVIFAGYPEEMQHFLEMNPGLKSRIPFYINFPNYSAEELYHIFELMATSKFKCGEGLLECAKEYFSTIPEEVKNDKSFGNARYVRSIYERTWGNAAKRAAGEGGEIAELLPEDFRAAVKEINQETPRTKAINPPRVGF